MEMGGEIVSLKDNEIHFKSKYNSDITARIVNNNGVIEVYNTIKRFMIFNKEKLVAKIIKTNEGFTILTVVDILYIDVQFSKKIYINNEGISYKSSFKKLFYQIK